MKNINLGAMKARCSLRWESDMSCNGCEAEDPEAVGNCLFEEIMPKDWPITTSNYGQEVKADAGKLRLSLVPTEIIKAIARIRMYGTEKYGDPDNWKNVEAERYVDAAYRHWLEFVKDHKSRDEESGLPHLWHCCCNLAFLCELEDYEK